MSSGSQIGGVVGGIVGGIIGFYTGNVAAGIQYGYAIGSAVGGYVDPTRTYGPRLEDASQQTSTVGGVIPFGYGVFTCAGNIIWADRLVEHKKTERVGKGGSEKQTTYTYTRSYAIGVCEGPIHNYLWVKVNGKLVYASDPAGLAAAMGWTGQMVGDLVASSNEWLQSTTLYRGTDTQMPDSTIVAVEGVGNVSPFRDLAYIVKENEDLTDMQGAVSQHEFCVRATPPEAYLTSHPYEQYFQDDSQVEPLFFGASTRALLIEVEVDTGNNETEIAPLYLGAITREALWGFDQYPEEGQIEPLFLGASTQNVFVSHTQPPEDFLEFGPVFNSAYTQQVLITNAMEDEAVTIAPLFNGASTT